MNSDVALFLYLSQVLDELIARAKTKSKALSGAKSLGLLRAIQKWERLREEIEAHMIHPGQNKSTINPLTRKRRVDIALTSSELYQRQRRRIRLSHESERPENGITKTNSSEKLRYSIESGIVSTLKKYSMNVKMDAAIADQLLHNPFKDKNMTSEQTQQHLGQQLSHYALSTEYFLRTLFLPESRTKLPAVKLKCSRLIALAVLAAEEELASMIGDEKREKRAREETLSYDEKVAELSKVSICILVSFSSALSFTKSLITCTCNIGYALIETQGYFVGKPTL